MSLKKVQKDFLAPGKPQVKFHGATAADRYRPKTGQQRRRAKYEAECDGFLTKGNPNLSTSIKECLQDEEAREVGDHKVLDLNGHYVQRKHIGDDKMIKEGEYIKQKREYLEMKQREEQATRLKGGGSKRGLTQNLSQMTRKPPVTEASLKRLTQGSKTVAPSKNASPTRVMKMGGGPLTRAPKSRAGASSWGGSSTSRQQFQFNKHQRKKKLEKEIEAMPEAKYQSLVLDITKRVRHNERAYSRQYK